MELSVIALHNEKESISRNALAIVIEILAAQISAKTSSAAYKLHNFTTSKIYNGPLPFYDDVIKHQQRIITTINNVKVTFGREVRIAKKTISVEY